MRANLRTYFNLFVDPWCLWKTWDSLLLAEYSNANDSNNKVLAKLECFFPVIGFPWTLYHHSFESEIVLSSVDVETSITISAHIWRMHIHKISEKFTNTHNNHINHWLALLFGSLLLPSSHILKLNPVFFSCCWLFCNGTTFHVDSPFSCFSLHRLNHFLLVLMGFGELQ
jgi:hypothetical protein